MDVKEQKEKEEIKQENPDKFVDIIKGSITKARKIKDLAPYLKDGWIRK